MTEHTHTPIPKFTSRIIPASETAEKMRNACNRFLESLTPEQRRNSNFDFGSTLVDAGIIFHRKCLIVKACLSSK